MDKNYAPPDDELGGEMYRRIVLLLGKNWGSWESFAAAFGLFGGLLAIVLGALDWAFVGLFAPAGAAGSILDAAGTVLLVVPLPLMALGAYCLDRLEKKVPALPRPEGPQIEAPRPVVRTLRPAPRRAATLAARGAAVPSAAGSRRASTKRA